MSSRGSKLYKCISGGDGDGEGGIRSEKMRTEKILTPPFGRRPHTSHLLLEGVAHGVLVQKIRRHVALRRAWIAGVAFRAHDFDNFSRIFVCGEQECQSGHGEHEQDVDVLLNAAQSVSDGSGAAGAPRRTLRLQLGIHLGEGHRASITTQVRETWREGAIAKQHNITPQTRPHGHRDGQWNISIHPIAASSLTPASRRRIPRPRKVDTSISICERPPSFIPKDSPACFGISWN